MHHNLQRAQLLLQQSRPEQAIDEIRQALVDEPNNSYAHSMLALCLGKSEQYHQATREAQLAIGLAPDSDFAHFAHAAVLASRNRFDEAERAINEALQLNPYDADYYAVLAEILLAQKRWNDALTSAEQGLSIDPEHINCTNMRAIALVKLGRKKEAGATIEAALAKAPENAFSHCNRGWTLLENGQHRQSLEHFREALRLEPEMEYAQQGIVEALKARNPIYRLMLNYFLWMAKLSGRAQWGIIIGAYVAFRFVSRVARDNPDLAPLLAPLIILYLVFVVLTWTAQPVFNLLLRFHPFGKWALSRDQIVASNWVGACIGSAILALVAALLMDSQGLLLMAFVCGLLTLSVSGTFGCQPGWPRRAMAVYTACLASLGFLGAGLVLVGENGHVSSLSSLEQFFVLAFFAGTFFFGIVANILSGILPRR